MYIIAVNCTGEIGGVTYVGDSCVINPNGEVLMHLFEEESILEYELVDNVSEFRSDFLMKMDRREDLYQFYLGH